MASQCLIVPAPAGVDTAATESISQSMRLFEARHFIFPLLAHSMGTMAVAVTAFFLAASSPRVVAYIIGAIFLAGGIAASSVIPAPAWFIVTGLILAYIPMAWVATQLGQRFSWKRSAL